MMMPGMPVSTLAMRSRPSRVFWPGLACGLAAALALQLAFMTVVSSAASDVAGRSADHGTAAMMVASVTCLLGAATTGVLTQLWFKRSVALNAYIAWSIANVVLMANIALTTNSAA